jgi:SAM-dependent methyltransferase
MFGERPIADAVRAARAIATNQVARFLPRTYVQMTGETGRGRGHMTAQDVADYHARCFDDYLAQLGVDRGGAAALLGGRRVLEYGPGDVPGVALLFVAYGAERVACVDRFPLMRRDGFAAEVLTRLLESLPSGARSRADRCFIERGEPRSGLAAEPIVYAVRSDGLLGEAASVGLVVSRAVLEHVNDLPATFRDMRQALAADGVALHLVDLKSHGLHRRNPLDFLTWPDWLWALMYSSKGVPNRLRPRAYREAARAAGLEVTAMSPTGRASPADVAEVRPRLADAFRTMPDDELAWLGFWMVCRPAPDR